MKILAKINSTRNSILTTGNICFGVTAWMLATLVIFGAEQPHMVPVTAGAALVYHIASRICSR